MGDAGWVMPEAGCVRPPRAGSHASPIPHPASRRHRLPPGIRYAAPLPIVAGADEQAPRHSRHHRRFRRAVRGAADVILKERRRLILVPRETPLSLVHLRNLTLATEAGAVVLPAAPGFYHKPQQVRDLVDFVVQRILDHLEIDVRLVKRWGGE